MQLPRILRQRDLTLLTIGLVIGSGIFIVPGAVLRQTGGDVGVALLVWLLAGVLSLLGALTYGELSAMDPEAGGLYVYIRDAFGRFPAFLFGWTLFFVISAGSQATLAVAFATYAGTFVELGAFGAKAVAVLMILVVAGINVWGTRESADVQNWTTVAKVLAILAMSAAFLLAGAGLGDAVSASFIAPPSLSLLSGVGLALIGVLWAYEGWQWATFSAGEAVDPQRTFPRAIGVGTAALAAIYVLANIGYVAALGPEAAAASDRVAADAMLALFGPAAAALVAAAIMVSIFSAANSTVLTSPRVYYAMARDGLFFRRLADIHPHFGTPAVAVVVGSVWAMLLAVTGTFEQLLTYVVFAGWAFYGLAAASIFVLRRRRPAAPRPFRVPGYPLTPALFVLAAAAIVVNTLFAQPIEALAGLAIIAAGTPAYLFWRRGGPGNGSGPRGAARPAATTSPAAAGENA